MNIEQIISSYPPLTHAKDLQEICNPLNTIGINYFAHVRVDNQNQFSAIGLKPEFAKLYLEKSYYNYDIHMAMHTTEEAYIIWDFLELDNQSKELRQDLYHFDLHHNFTIVQPGDHGKEYFHFATSAKNDHANNNYLQNLTYLKKFIQYFKEKTHEHKQLAKSFNFKFSIAEENANFSTNTPLRATDETLDQQLALNRIYINDNGAYLTRREFECLYWLSMGKTLNDIGTLLAITPRTVKAHIANIKIKVGCYNQFQLGRLYEKFKSYVKLGDI